MVVIPDCLETYPESICFGTGSHGHEFDFVTGILCDRYSILVTCS